MTEAAIGPPRRQVVIISGPPASGKTTIARPLAAELDFALIAKDQIKEILHDALGREAELTWSRQLGAASMELLWALGAQAPYVVLEANFWTGDERARAGLGSLGATPVEVHCACPVEECMRRYAARMPGRHPAHVDGHAARNAHEVFDRCAQPFGLGPVITADTTRPVAIGALAVQVRRLLTAAEECADLSL